MRIAKGLFKGVENSAVGALGDSESSVWLGMSSEDRGPFSEAVVLRRLFAEILAQVLG
jgi:hypothetical protein